MDNDQSKQKQAERLVKLRRDKGLTAEQLAQAMTEAGAKVSRGAISNWERGTNGIVSSKLPTLARILGCSEGYLLRGDHHTNIVADTDLNADSNAPRKTSLTCYQQTHKLIIQQPQLAPVQIHKTILWMVPL